MVLINYKRQWHTLLFYSIKYINEENNYNNVLEWLPIYTHYK